MSKTFDSWSKDQLEIYLESVRANSKGNLKTLRDRASRFRQFTMGDRTVLWSPNDELQIGPIDSDSESSFDSRVDTLDEMRKLINTLVSSVSKVPFTTTVYCTQNSDIPSITTTSSTYSYTTVGNTVANSVSVSRIGNNNQLTDSGCITPSNDVIETLKPGKMSVNIQKSNFDYLLPTHCEHLLNKPFKPLIKFEEINSGFEFCEIESSEQDVCLLTPKRTDTIKPVVLENNRIKPVFQPLNEAKKVLEVNYESAPAEHRPNDGRAANRSTFDPRVGVSSAEQGYKLGPAFVRLLNENNHLFEPISTGKNYSDPQSERIRENRLNNRSMNSSPLNQVPVVNHRKPLDSIVRKWGIKFTGYGKASVEDFLERVDDVMEISSVTKSFVRPYYC